MVQKSNHSSILLMFSPQTHTSFSIHSCRNADSPSIQEEQILYEWSHSHQKTKWTLFYIWLNLAVLSLISLISTDLAVFSSWVITIALTLHLSHFKKESEDNLKPVLQITAHITKHKFCRNEFHAQIIC